METIEKKLLSVEEVGLVLGIARSSVYRLIDSKALACVRMGKSVRIHTLEVDRYIDSLSHPAEVA